MTPISSIKKRDGRAVPFDQNKITEAIWKAAQSVGGTDRTIAEKISNQVSTVLEVFFKDPDNLPTVEQIQDLVEKILIENGHAKTAKAFILYREKHHKLRELLSKINYTQAKKSEGIKEKPIENSSDYSMVNLTADPQIMLEGLGKMVTTAQTKSTPLVFNFSDIDAAQEAAGKSPIDFFKIFDIFCQAFISGEQPKKCSVILQIDHPSVPELIKLQAGEQKLTNLSILIGITADFIEAVKKEDAAARNLIELIMDEKSALGIIFLSEGAQQHEILKAIQLPLDHIEEVIPPPIQAMI